MAALALRNEVIPIKTSPPHPSAVVLGPAADAAKANVETGYRRVAAPEWLMSVIACAMGLAAFLAAWAAVAKFGGRIPDPLTVGAAAAKIFADPFYSKGPNDQGIGWNILSSLRRVGIGFGLAALVGIPLGFAIGRFRFLSGMAAPIIALLKPVSPLAWLPIGLLVLKRADPAAIR